jgi:hypothetical protein
MGSKKLHTNVSASPNSPIRSNVNAEGGLGRVWIKAEREITDEKQKGNDTEMHLLLATRSHVVRKLGRYLKPQ